MEKRQKLYAYQYVALLVLSCLANLFVIGMVEGQAGSALWPAFWLSLLPGLALCALQAGQFAQNPGLGFGDILQRAYGRL